MTPTVKQIERLDADELAEMLSVYTEVTERLRATHDKLTAEVARLRGELASKNRQLERRGRLAALGQMAAGMAHEIRNPLGGIALYAGLLIKQLDDRPKARDVAQRISSGVMRLDGIVNDILTFAGEMEPQPRPTRLSAILAEAVELAQGRFERSGTELVLDVACDVEFPADGKLLVRAVSNLLFNAIDAAAEGQVRLSAGRTADRVTIVVADSGPGIESDVMDKIFNPFFTTKDAGTGLGLAIVHRIVDSHGGQVSVGNYGPPDGLGGAVFSIRLPVQSLPS